MNPREVLVELFNRLGAARGSSVFVRADELAQWPEEAVRALTSQQLLVRARHATSVVCPGCERACVMPVQTISRAGSATTFVICDKRDDINQVRVSPEQLTQWKCDEDSVRGFIAESLGLSRSNQGTDLKVRPIGIASGKKHRQMLCLRCDGVVSLVAGNSEASLGELLEYGTHSYSLDTERVRELVDAGVMSDPRYTPTSAKRDVRKIATQKMHGRWQRAYRDLKKRHPGMSDVWYSRKIARESISAGRMAETIRKHMKK